MTLSLSLSLYTSLPSVRAGVDVTFVSLAMLWAGDDNPGGVAMIARALHWFL